MSRITLSFRPFTLELKHQFTVATYSRATTPIVLVNLTYQGITGYGEASLPPYLGETQESVISFLSKLNFSSFNDPQNIDGILDYADNVSPGNNAAKASVDIALHDLVGKLQGKPLYKIWDLDPMNTPLTSYTIGIDSPSSMAEKVKEVKDFRIIKIKLGTSYDRDIIEAVRRETNVPLMADVNQGWNNKEFALDMAHWLKDIGVILLEQPLPKESTDDLAWLSQHSPLPIFADEGIKRLNDLERNIGVYNGVNVKLMKSTGLREARKIIELAKKHNLLTMIGCMTETSCAVAAASQISPMCHYADLDGPFLIRNNPFNDLQVRDGKIIIPESPGTGVDVKHI